MVVETPTPKKGKKRKAKDPAEKKKKPKKKKKGKNQDDDEGVRIVKFIYTMYIETQVCAIGPLALASKIRFNLVLVEISPNLVHFVILTGLKL